jgi:hypothetical protein
MWILLQTLCLVWSGTVGGQAAETLQLLQDRPRERYGLRAVDAPLARIGQALGRATGCEVELAPELRVRRLTASLSPRSPEALFQVLARRADASLTVAYRVELAPPGEPRRTARVPFAREIVSPGATGQVDLQTALQRVIAPVQVAEGVRGAVRVTERPVRLSDLMDSVTRQLGAVWKVVVRLEPRRPVDEAAAADERTRAYFQDLAGLSSSERQEELAADLQALRALPPAERDRRVRQLAADIVGMGSLLRQVPGEHRAPVQEQVRAIGADHQAVLARLGSGQQSLSAPLLEALAALAGQLAEIR